MATSSASVEARPFIGKAYQLHAPAFVDTREQREMLLAMGPVREILYIARQATVALLGVGAVDYEASRLVQFTALSAENMTGHPRSL